MNTKDCRWPTITGTRAATAAARPAEVNAQNLKIGRAAHCPCRRRARADADSGEAVARITITRWADRRQVPEQTLSRPPLSSERIDDQILISFTVDRVAPTAHFNNHQKQGNDDDRFGAYPHASLSARLPFRRDLEHGRCRRKVLVPGRHPVLIAGACS